MANTYLSFISDEHLVSCINVLQSKYKKCQQQMTLDKFFANKVDPIKFLFDMQFNCINDIKDYLNLEVLRQNDKTISNAIGEFHQALIGGLPSIIDMGVGNGCDIRNESNTIFGEIKNKHNTMNSSSKESTYQKLIQFAENYPESTCYLIEIISDRSQDILWHGSFNGHYYSHPRVRRISADKFYAKITGIDDAFLQLCRAIMMITRNMNNLNQKQDKSNNSLVYDSLVRNATLNNTNDLLALILIYNFYDYNGFSGR